MKLEVRRLSNLINIAHVLRSRTNPELISNQLCYTDGIKSNGFLKDNKRCLDGPGDYHA